MIIVKINVPLITVSETLYGILTLFGICLGSVAYVFFYRTSLIFYRVATCKQVNDTIFICIIVCLQAEWVGVTLLMKLWRNILVVFWQIPDHV